MSIAVYRIKELLPHEIIFLTRRRRGLSQFVVAKMFGVTQAAISRYERGERKIPLALYKSDWFKIKLSSITKGENLVLMRLRTHECAWEIAHKRHMSRPTYLKMEQDKSLFRKYIR